MCKTRVYIEWWKDKSMYERLYSNKAAPNPANNLMHATANLNLYCKRLSSGNDNRRIATVYLISI